MLVWGPDNDVACIHPGGARLDGRDEIEQSWREIFDHDAAMQFQLQSSRKQGDANYAVHLVKEEIRIAGVVRGVVISTNIYRRYDDGWRIILHHASAPPGRHHERSASVH